MFSKPWVSFCISTYNRPILLEEQLNLLSQQTFENYEVVVSDNDPDGSAKDVLIKFDERFKYFHNSENLGMIKSFNLSIDRAISPFVLMVTDDDPIDIHFLEEMRFIENKYKGFAMYGGALRRKKPNGSIEIFNNDNFLSEILSPKKTETFLWSNIILDRSVVKQVGSIPDYGSPALSDHALLLLVGSNGGAVIKNKIYSTYTSHTQNYSKLNLQIYISGYDGFVNCLLENNLLDLNQKNNKAIQVHLKYWFLYCTFALKKFYSLHDKNPNAINEINNIVKCLLEKKLLKRYKIKYFFKNVVFKIKLNLGLLNGK